MKMKNVKINIVTVGLVLLIASCSGNHDKSYTQVSTEDTMALPSVITEEVIEVSEGEGVSQAEKDKACSELKSYGAKDAYFEDDYLCYVVEESDLSASAYEVGKALYPMFEDIKGLKGIKVVSATNHKIMGVYPN